MSLQAADDGSDQLQISAAAGSQRRVTLRADRAGPAEAALGIPAFARTARTASRPRQSATRVIAKKLNVCATIKGRATSVQC
jgi:hypothetical protein